MDAKRFAWNTAAIAGVAVLLPALAAAQRTTCDYDRTAPFADYRTYALTRGTSSGEPIVDARLEAALEDQLTLKGLSKLTALPDVKVRFHAVFDNEHLSLVIDLVDVNRQQVVWRCARSKDVGGDPDPGARDAHLARAVARIMRNYPPVSDDD